MAAHLKKRVYEEFTKVVQVSEESSELCRVIPVSVGRAVVAAWGLTQVWLPGIRGALGLPQVWGGLLQALGEMRGMWWPQLGEGEDSWEV